MQRDPLPLKDYLSKMTCPICKKETAQKFRPFCSKRCADVDLGRWFSGYYAVPADSDEDVEAAAAEVARATRRDH